MSALSIFPCPSCGTDANELRPVPASPNFKHYQCPKCGREFVADPVDKPKPAETPATTPTVTTPPVPPPT